MLDLKNQIVDGYFHDILTHPIHCVMLPLNSPPSFHEAPSLEREGVWG